MKIRNVLLKRERFIKFKQNKNNLLNLNLKVKLNVNRSADKLTNKNNFSKLRVKRLRRVFKKLYRKLPWHYKLIKRKKFKVRTKIINKRPIIEFFPGYKQKLERNQKRAKICFKRLRLHVGNPSKKSLARIPYFIFNFNRLYAKKLFYFKKRYKKRLRIKGSYKHILYPRTHNAPYVKVDYSEFYKQIKAPYLIGKLIFRMKRNNLFVSLSNIKNKLLYKTSGGICGYKGPKRATPYAKEKISKAIGEKAMSLNYKIVDLYFKYPPNKRYYHMLKGLGDSNIAVRLCYAYKGVPHGNLRAKKRRRL